MTARKKKKIVFVCTGNTCRSPMAQLLLTKYLKDVKLKGFDVRSAGIAAKKGDTINPKSAQVLQENGIACESFSSTKLTNKTLVDAFAVVCMTERQREYLMDMRWNALKKAGMPLDDVENNVYSFAEITGYEILDPYGKDIDCYRYVYGLLSAGMARLSEKLRLTENAWETKPRAPKKAKKTDTKKAPKKTKTTPTQPKADGDNKQLSIF
ncbi:MAG: hypothetical protein E7352_04035 [Clostridiales bacterium]|nr:hypothetical protein [Clostridiales bacterium]